MHHCVFVSWDGNSTPFGNIRFDETPQFQLAIFCYSGRGDATLLPPNTALINIKTECKGEIYSEVISCLSQQGAAPEYVGLIDDDVEIAVSSINAMIAEASMLALGSFSASLTHDSICAHDKFRQHL